MLRINISGRQTGPVLMLFVVLLLATGCRTYGGYGAEDLTYTQMEQAHQVFEEELARARANLNVLESASAESPYLSVLAAQYAQLVRGHEAILESHADVLDRVSPGDDYRELHRAFGAVIAEQATVRRQYDDLLNDFHRAFSPPDTTDRVERPYALIPPFYERIRARRDLSVSEVLAQVRSAGAPSPGFTFATPEAAASSSPEAGHGEAAGSTGDNGEPRASEGRDDEPEGSAH